MLLKTTLAYYDCTQPLVLQNDASEYGLGTALIQNNRPIAFASKTLTDVETRYVNIEREYLSVWLGLEKFHTYMYGKHIKVQNDHEPTGDDPEETNTHSTAKTSMYAFKASKIWLHDPICPRQRYGLGRQVIKVPFMQK